MCFGYESYRTHIPTGLEQIGQAVGEGVIAVRPGGRSRELSGKTTAGGECDFWVSAGRSMPTLGTVCEV